MSTTVTLRNKEELLEAIQRVRQDKSAVNWVLVTHHEDNPNELVLVATGEDGIEGLRGRLDESKVMYALLRTTEIVDMSTTVKFAYIYFTGDKVPFVRRGRFGVVKGDATKYFQPYHVDVEVTHPKELKEEEIKSKISEAAGTASKVREAGFIEGKQERGFTARSNPSLAAGKSASSSNLTSKAPPVATQAQGVEIAQETLAALAKVRNDKLDTKWILASYQDNDIKKPIIPIASGSGSVDDDLKEHLAANKIIYGIVRVVDQIDKSATVKFAFILWIGKDVGMMSKAKVSTHKGAVTAAFSPYHVDFNISELREISDEIVLNKVQATSGSKSFVKS